MVALDRPAKLEAFTRNNQFPLSEQAPAKRQGREGKGESGIAHSDGARTRLGNQKRLFFEKTHGAADLSPPAVYLAGLNRQDFISFEK